MSASTRTAPRAFNPSRSSPGARDAEEIATTGSSVLATITRVGEILRSPEKQRKCESKIELAERAASVTQVNAGWASGRTASEGFTTDEKREAARSEYAITVNNG